MSDSDIAGDLPDDRPQPEAARAERKRKRPVTTEGPHRIFVLLASGEGLRPKRPEGAEPGPEPAEGKAMILGLALVRWEWLSVEQAAHEDGALALQLRGESRAHQIYGYIGYRVLAAARLTEVVTVAAGAAVPAVLSAIAQSTASVHRSGRLVGGTVAASALMSSWREQQHALPAVAVAELAPWLAAEGVLGKRACLHMVAATNRMRRQSTLVRDEPSRRQLRALVDAAQETATASIANPQPVVPVRQRHHKCILDPEELLEWLKITATLKDLRQMPNASHAFSKIFMRRLRAQHPDIESVEVPVAGYETLRQARVRADCVAMKLHRSFIHKLSDSAQIFIYCDASPQWRGFELFATSFDIWDGHDFHRRLAPVISLERTDYDAQGKMKALLWQIWLMAGPKAEDMIRFCTGVRALVTDQGTERMLATMPDALVDFWEMLPEAGEPPPAREFTFPRALEVPGWMHLWDTVLRRGLSSLSFFPQWMSQTRALAAFLRTAPMVTQLSNSIKATGRSGIAEMITSLKLPAIATWRWKTLVEFCKTLEPVIETLRLYFDPQLFKNSKDPARMKTVASALREEEWLLQFRFILWFTAWLCGIMSWVGGCDCCQDEPGEVPANSSCPRKGRRLKVAHRFAKAELERGLREANAWEADFFGGGERRWQELQGCVRSAVHLALQKIGFLGEVPYLLVRLDEPGVRDEVLTQWAATPPENHHKVTREFLTEGSPLRAAVDALQDDGSNVSPALAEELHSLRSIPLDDSVAEGPHARAKKIIEHSKGATWAWTASTMRLAQNLKDIQELGAALNERATTVWGKYKTILQTNPKKYSQNLKVNRKEFTNRLYHMSHLLRTDQDDQTEPLPLEDADAPDDPEVPLPPRAQQPLQDLEAQRGEVEEHGPRQGPRKEPLVMLMRQYFLSALTPMSYISVPMMTEDGFVPQFFQVLRIEPKALAPKTYTVERDEEADPILFEVGVQHLERWEPMSHDPAALGNEAEVFIFDDTPRTVDIFRACGFNPANRRMFLEWQARKSDVPDCINLHSPTMVEPKMALSASDVPCLVLMDALYAKGFSMVQVAVQHTVNGPTEFDGRRPTSKRNYFKCVLVGDELFGDGVVGFPSTKSSVWFAYLLKFRKCPPEGMSARAIQKAIGGQEGGEVFEALADGPAIRLALAPGPVAEDPGASSDPDIAGDELPVAIVAAPPPQAEELPLPPPPAGEEEIAGDLPAEGPLGWPDFLEGVRIHVVKGRHKDGYSYYDRLQAFCPNPQHPNCQKSRSTQLQVGEAGPRAAVGFMGRWLRQAHDMTAAEHRRYTPSVAEVRAYLAEQ